MSAETMAKAYEPAEVERKWYPEWERRGYFRGNPKSSKPAYTIVIPPPNVTGMLTLGHVLNNTLQDILIRWEKMRGREVCWVPGTDHAGIATQTKVEQFLRQSENLSRYDLGREEFLKRVWDWKEKYGGTIIRQLRRLGTACDWERERFTLDEGLSSAVEETFIRLYRKGLIYKGHRIINWCPRSRTALSDEEVIYKEEKGHLWYFRYPLSEGNGHITVATTRPETMLGDTAVAVHPHDLRYLRQHGKTVRLPLVNREIPVICDEYVEREFGTGAVKVTPAHDPNDYEMGLRHNLPMIDVMNDDGTMNEAAGEAFAGMDRYACRRAVVERMEALGLVEKIEDHVHQVGFSERGDVPVEPRLSKQWFVRTKALAEPALRAVEDGHIRFHPDRWVKTYRHWMENIRDWCISRQLWWGHRIPAYTCAGCGEIVVARQAPQTCPKCHTHEFHQDEDVLDTWFSSWLWPFSVFGWPHETDELKAFYPTSTLVTGPDIIFFWVARMIMAGHEFMGRSPFSNVYFTSIIRDEQGRKLSKSLNNSPDPIEVIDRYGADALRFTMIYISPMGQDLRYSNEKCEIGRNFANKLWNASRFRLQQGPCSPDWQTLDGLDAAHLRADDQWMLANLNTTVRDTTAALENFQFHDCVHSLYEALWNEFCDWYLESAKAVFYGDDAGQRQTTLRVFDFALSNLLRLLHPIMPFVTEELYHQLGFIAEGDSIMLTDWPRPLSDDDLRRLGVTAEGVAMVSGKFELVRAVRNLRASYQVPPGRRLPVIVAPADPARQAFLLADQASLKALLQASELTLDPHYQKSGPTGVALAAIGSAYVPLKDAIDLDAERARLDKQEKELLGFIGNIDRKLANEGFVAKAPPEVVRRERERRQELQEKLGRLREQLALLG
ncbi:MAG: Valine--tRNA ligase [Lentisphaerae bacterium ADurb.BinA184]|nr:MAG: Valine--tRNA ligase [Lentisphaerae bacterium ADurb.BinA184]